ncbi:hypothetical protein B5F40_05585 [Gordonibacter sp. An230]|uniref:thioredoxin family protein n=1 Tax=Gordonibacter sp. An230 TaxID=1965592 RepID=UPI000B391F60|nr:thioredoxin family protein [Gordonibacter sp. An230]OUO90665.1 hypothetical protein B5F40_05585 [Gordonibacter sp. An230]
MSAFESLNAAAFEEIVEDDGEHCLVLFSRKSCTVCKSVHAKLEALKEDYPSVPFFEVDVEEQPGLMAKQHLKGVPQTLFFADGEAQSRITGDASEDDFADRIEAL